MNDRQWIQGVSATTHLDSHGERLSKEQLQRMAQAFSAEEEQLIYWHHETTLPPIGVLMEQWVEEREDGEYQLCFRGYLFRGEDFEPVSQDKVKGLDFTRRQAAKILGETEPVPSGRLTILYDPRNFDTEEVAPIVEQMNELVETEHDLYIRKAELPQPVIWAIVGFVAGNVAVGFFSRLGEMLAEKTVESVRDASDRAVGVLEGLYEQLAEHFASLIKKARPKGKHPDIIFPLSIPDVQTQVEGALENADPASVRGALQSLPYMYAFAVHLLEQNPPNFFSIMRFLYNPEREAWEINYLVTRKTNRVIQGARYYVPTHPLRARYEEVLRSVTETSPQNRD